MSLGEDGKGILAILESIQSSPVSDSLAAFTSMHDLMVVELPLRDLPYDVIAVRPHPHDQIEIEHLSVTGRNDKIVRPFAAAVPLFWRFVNEKFGLQP